MDSTSAHGRANSLAASIAARPYVADTLCLPDLHMKDGMEAPSSFVTATRGVIVPHLVSESINDGMGLIRTNVQTDDLAPDELDAILRFVNRAGARTKMDTTPYSWTLKLLEQACREGAAPLLDHYGLDERFLDAIEDRGRATPETLSAEEFEMTVPSALRRTRITRGEIGLNFGGNHFLELQSVDRIVDPAEAERLGVSQGELMIMYHLGPGPLGSILSNLHAYRSKPQLHRKAGYALGRQILHGKRGLEFHRTFARLNDWLEVDADTAQGNALASVLRVIKNYGFAYRTATMKAIGDALETVLGVDPADVDLVVDMSHNMLEPEMIGDEEFWVSRHNCCRPRPGMPGIVAGNHQVPSCLSVGPAACDTRLSGYDHGVGFLIDEAGRAGDLMPDPKGRDVKRLTMVRGEPDVHKVDTFPLLDAAVTEEAIGTLSAAGMTDPVAYLRPLATLKHKV